MVPSPIEEDVEQFSGNELDEPEAAEFDSTPKSEDEDAFAGNELDEPGAAEFGSTPKNEDEDALAGIELDEPEAAELDAIPKNENVQEDSGKHVEELGQEDRESVQEVDDLKGSEGKTLWKKGLLLCIALGICLLVGMGYVYLGKKNSTLPLSQKEAHQEKATQWVKKSVILKNESLRFHPFVIPVKKNSEFTYITLRFTFPLPNKELKREMLEKKEQLRGRIYDTLREEINKTTKLPSLEELKAFIIKEVNLALSAGKIHEVHITQFLAV